MLRHFLKSFVVISLVLSPVCWAGVDFNGDADYINLSDITVESTPLSMCAVFNIDDYSADERTIVSKRSAAATTDRAFSWRVTTTGIIQFNTRGASTEVITETDVSVITEGVDYCACVRFDGTAGQDKADIFVDGVQKTIDAINDDTNVIQNVNEAITIGRQTSNNDPMDGKIFDVAFWTGVELSDSEIANYCNAKRMALQLQPSSLKWNLPLDDYADGTDLNTDVDGYKDISVNGDHGQGVDADVDSSNVAETVLTYQ